MAMAKPKQATSIVLAMMLASPCDAAVNGRGDAYRDFLYPKLHTAASACYGNQNMGTMLAAASVDLWNGGKACGDNYVVTCTGATNDGVPHPCTGKSVNINIVDLCPASSCRATIDLSQEAFAIIANPDAGKIEIKFHRI